MSGNHKLQFNKIIVVSFNGSITLSGTKTSRTEKHKFVGTEIKDFASGPLGIVVSDATSVSTP